MNPLSLTLVVSLHIFKNKYETLPVGKSGLETGFYALGVLLNKISKTSKVGRVLNLIL